MNNDTIIKYNKLLIDRVSELTEFCVVDFFYFILSDDIFIITGNSVG